MAAINEGEPRDAKHDLVEVQKVEDTVSDGKQTTNFDLVDKELAQYMQSQPVHIDDKTNRRLKKQIDRRVLVVMIVTYFLQSVDKGALGFASIMGIRTDTHLVGAQVRVALQDI